MTPFERHQAILNGETPDKVDIVVAEGLRTGPQGGWIRRLQERGMGLTHIVPPYKPMFFFDTIVNPYIKDISYSITSYYKDGIWMNRHSFETPVGTVFADVGINPDLNLGTGSVISPFIKDRKDWKPINYLFKRMYETLRPNYKEIELDQEDLGQSGTTIAVVDRTPFQRLWISLTSIEDAVYAIFDGIAEVEEFVEIQYAFHKRAAEITAGCPAQQIQLIDNITNTISPELYLKYCIPFYKIYTDAFKGTNKKLSVHQDGLMGHLKNEIADAPFDIIDSFTVPPMGNVSISEAKRIWPEKQLFINLPPHMAFESEKKISESFSSIVSEWGNNRLVIEHVEDMPEEILEKTISAALDICGY